MRLLCTFPGRFGDLLWALPTVRAISEHVETPVDLWIGDEFASLIPLLDQPYLGTVTALPEWDMREWKAPREAPADYDDVFDLGYRAWPEQALPFEVARTLREVYHLDLPIDLARPWITMPPLWTSWGTACLPCGFTEAWFELKVGLVRLLQDILEGDCALMPVSPPGSRWATVFAQRAYTWIEAAEFIKASDLFFGDCSALHVLAVALGKPKVLLMEPMTARHNPIFYPLGTTGRVTLITGNDGHPTFDVNHCADAIREARRG